LKLWFGLEWENCKLIDLDDKCCVVVSFFVKIIFYIFRSSENGNLLSGSFLLKQKFGIALQEKGCLKTNF